MHKKGSKILLVAFVLMLVFAASGCVNTAAEPFSLQRGITLCPYYDGENYGAQIFIFTNRLTKNYPGSGGVVISSSSPDIPDSYVLDILSSEFKTKRIEGYPQTVTNESGGNDYVFGYDIKINEEDWFFADDAKPQPKSRFFTGEVSVDYSNPFAQCFQAGTRFNSIYLALSSTSDSFGSVYDYFNISPHDLNSTTTTVLMDGTYTLKPEGEYAGVMFEQEMNYHYYYLTVRFDQTPQTRLKYTYSFVQSYAWYALAVVLGLLAVVLVLLVAKKMNGRVVDTKQKKTVQPSVAFIFDPFDDGKGGNSGGGASGGSSGVFDGF